jgi:hypothetical protein
MRAYPGLGNADQIARREAWEEIGLPVDDAKIPRPFHFEHLCYLPHHLAKTELVVRPCVALLHPGDPSSPSPSPSPSPLSNGPTAEESLIPRLDAKEVAAVFSAPFHNFLRATDEEDLQRKPLPKGRWYEGSWTNWHDESWRAHYFYVPVNNQRVAKPKVREGGLAAIAELAEEEAEEVGRYKVWGMTARILVDAATVAYGEKPEFEHNAHFGDEKIIEALHKMGRLTPQKTRGCRVDRGGLEKSQRGQQNVSGNSPQMARCGWMLDAGCWVPDARC